MAVDADNFEGLCRICGCEVRRSMDPTDYVPTLCSETCLQQAIIAYWAALGLDAIVVLRDGYARLEGLAKRGPALSLTSA